VSAKSHFDVRIVIFTVIGCLSTDGFKVDFLDLHTFHCCTSSQRFIMTMSKEPSRDQPTVSAATALAVSSATMMLLRQANVQVIGRSRRHGAVPSALRRGELVALLEEAMAIGAMFAPSCPSDNDDCPSDNQGKRQ
jgi:hypothetical protein